MSERANSRFQRYLAVLTDLAQNIKSTTAKANPFRSSINIFLEILIQEMHFTSFLLCCRTITNFTTMSVSSVACCPIVSHDKHADGTDRQTD